MKLLKNIIKESKSDIAIKTVQKLGKRLMHGLSTENDITEWESNLEFVNKFQEQFNELFLKYLLKHYPNDERLKERYCDSEGIDNARDAMYRESLFQTLGDALYMLKYKRRDFDFELFDKWKHDKLITEIEKYIYFKNKSREMFFIKENDKPDSFLEWELEYILKDVYAYMPYKTVEQEEWHVRANHIGSFKYLEYDGESIYRKRHKLGLKHGILLGNVGSGKTKATQKEIKLILESTNDDVIVIDNDGLYEEFCKQNNGEYIKITIDTTFFDNNVTINNRLIVLNIHRLNDEIKFQYASKALKYAYKRINELSESSRNTWLYIEEVNELIFDEYFYHIIIHCSSKNGIITIVTNNVMDVIENNNSSRLLTNSGYIRLFRQFSRYRKSLAEFISIDSNMLGLDDIEMSWAIMGNKTIKIKDKII